MNADAKFPDGVYPRSSAFIGGYSLSFAFSVRSVVLDDL